MNSGANEEPEFKRVRPNILEIEQHIARICMVQDFLQQIKRVDIVCFRHGYL